MIYFDNAATSLQKPGSVAAATSWAIQNCASPGRGDYIPSQRAGDILFRCRTELAEMLDIQEPERIIFTQNATHSLNLAIRSLLNPGDTVLVSAWEHNAVTRTIASIPNVRMLVAQAPLFDDPATVQAFAEQLEQKPALVVCTAVSNVFGYILPLTEISGLCRRAGVPLVVDASQAVGCVPVDWSAVDAQYIAFPGHKGLYGPQGTGVLAACIEDPERLKPLLTGGTGSVSIRQSMPDVLPDRGEAGTQNVAGIAGLLQGVRFVKKTGVARIACHERQLTERLGQRLARCPGIHPFFSETGNQAGVVSFCADGLDSQLLAEELGRHGVAVRAGLHCAPLAHRSGGTLETGTVRVSFSAFNRREEVDQFVHILERVCHDKLT